MQTIIKYMNSKFIDCHFNVYLLQNNQSDNYGEFNISFSTYSSLLGILNKQNINVKKYTQTNYQFNNMELICTHENDSVSKKYISKDYKYQTIIDNTIINIFKINSICPQQFPILYKYTNESTFNINEFSFKYIKLYLVKQNNMYYVYMTFKYKQEFKNNIIEDINDINNIFTSIKSI